MTKNAFEIALAAFLLVPSMAAAQDDYADEHAAERARGETSPGTAAPTTSTMVSVLTRGTPSAIQATLEYGERVECHECVPLAENLLLSSDDALTREMAAWWLRRRMFAIGAVMQRMRTVLATDEDPVRRARAAEAIGEFLDPNGFPHLASAASGDADAGVRRSAVLALGRLQHAGSVTVVGDAMEDADSEVRRAALEAASRLRFFNDVDALLGLLSDGDAEIRARAAQQLGTQGDAGAVASLAALLAGDADAGVRRAAAWALGQIGGGDARAALADAEGSESNGFVLQAIRIARAM